MNSRGYTLVRRGKTIVLSEEKDIIEKRESDVFAGVEVAVATHPVHGNILYLDGEAQISNQDYYLYHLAMLSLMKAELNSGGKILVIGDGDGGFSSLVRDDLCPYKVTQVEPCGVTREMASKYFGVDWSNVNLYDCTLSGFLKEEQKSMYDGIFLAITDDFNLHKDNLDDIQVLWEKYLKAGGALICQVGCKEDPNFTRYLSTYRMLQNKLSLIHKNLSYTQDSEPYISVFHSTHLFRAFYKESV